MKKGALILFIQITILQLEAHAQLQSLELSSSTNNLVVPIGKVIKVHSLIGASTSGSGVMSPSNIYQRAEVFYPRALLGIKIILPSGNSIDVSSSNVSTSGGNDSQSFFVLSSLSSVVAPNSFLIPGPVTIERNGSGTLLMVYEIFDNIGSSSSTLAPSQGSSVVIPTSTAGDVDVKMEQSADNVTWTECLPGTYSSSTVKRFFRLRAVEK